MEKIKPIFQDLAQPGLLNKCLHGRTQNPNESVNSVIWTRIPKTVFVGINTLHFGVYNAVATFNEGNIVKYQVLQELVMSAGSRTIEAMLHFDKDRLRNAENKLQNLFRRATQHRAAKRKLLAENEEEEENPSYGAGLF